MFSDSFKTIHSLYDKVANFFIDVAIFLLVSWPDELLVYNVIDYYAKVNKLDNNRLTKVFNEIKSR